MQSTFGELVRGFKIFIFKKISMTKVVYKRGIKKEDFIDDDEIIYFYDNNIAYIIVKKDNHYIIRKKKIFNNQLLLEKNIKTSSQILGFFKKKVI